MSLREYSPDEYALRAYDNETDGVVNLGEHRDMVAGAFALGVVVGALGIALIGYLLAVCL